MKKYDWALLCYEFDFEKAKVRLETMGEKKLSAQDFCKAKDIEYTQFSKHWAEYRRDEAKYYLKRQSLSAAKRIVHLGESAVSEQVQLSANKAILEAAEVTPRPGGSQTNIQVNTLVQPLFQDSAENRNLFLEMISAEERQPTPLAIEESIGPSEVVHERPTVSAEGTDGLPVDSDGGAGASEAECSVDADRPGAGIA